MREVISEVRTKLKGQDLSMVDMKKLWKALFYGTCVYVNEAMWHSDKHVNQ